MIEKWKCLFADEIKELIAHLFFGEFRIGRA